MTLRPKHHPVCSSLRHKLRCCCCCEVTNTDTEAPPSRHLIIVRNWLTTAEAVKDRGIGPVWAGARRWGSQHRSVLMISAGASCPSWLLRLKLFESYSHWSLLVSATEFIFTDARLDAGEYDTKQNSKMFGFSNTRCQLVVLWKQHRFTSTAGPRVDQMQTGVRVLYNR